MYIKEYEDGVIFYGYVVIYIYIFCQVDLCIQEQEEINNGLADCLGFLIVGHIHIPDPTIFFHPREKPRFCLVAWY